MKKSPSPGDPIKDPNPPMTDPIYPPMKDPINPPITDKIIPDKNPQSDGEVDIEPANERLPESVAERD